MDLSIVKFIQRASCDFLDKVFSFLTVLGESSMFFMMFVAIYLCYKKDFAVRYMFYFILGSAFNDVLKSVFARPRPYTHSGVLDVRHTSGYSMPSGHSQSFALQATMIGGEFCRNNNSKKHRLTVIITLVVLGFIVGLSRIYLGQHYLTDVLVGLAIGVLFAIGLEILFNLIPAKVKKFISTRAFLLLMIVPVLIMIVLVEYCNLGNANFVTFFYTYVAIYLGVLIGYNIDKTFVQYKERAVWYIQLIKIAIACVGIVLLSFAFEGIVNEMVRNFCFYFTATLYVTAVLPVIFKLVFGDKYAVNDCKTEVKENKEESK